MNEKELKTSTKQRVVISIIAIVMLVSIVAGYVAIIAGGASSTSSSEISEAKVAEYAAAYQEKLDNLNAATGTEFTEFKKYQDRVTTYDETATETAGVVTKDLAVGNGRELTAGDKNYIAFYEGWCADGTVFDSSLDSTTEPTGFASALNASTIAKLYDGWEEGVVGMKLGGVREIAMPGEKAAGETQELCGGYNKPVKFIVMAVANEEPLTTLAQEATDAYWDLIYYTYYGIDNGSSYGY